MTRKGAAHVYKRQEKHWQHHTKLVASNGRSGDQLGSSTSISENFIALGTEYSNSSKGSVILYQLVDQVWQEAFELVADDAQSHDHFGSSLSLSDHYVTIGAYNKKFKKEASGEAYIFSLGIKNEKTQAEIDLENTLSQLTPPSV